VSSATLRDPKGEGALQDGRVRFPGAHASVRTTRRRHLCLPPAPRVSEQLAELSTEPESFGTIRAFPLTQSWAELGQQTRHHLDHMPAMEIGEADLGPMCFYGKWVDVVIDGCPRMRVFQGKLTLNGQVVEHFKRPTVLALATAA